MMDGATGVRWRTSTCFETYSRSTGDKIASQLLKKLDDLFHQRKNDSSIFQDPNFGPYPHSNYVRMLIRLLISFCSAYQTLFDVAYNFFVYRLAYNV